MCVWIIQIFPLYKTLQNVRFAVILLCGIISPNGFAWIADSSKAEISCQSRQNPLSRFVSQISIYRGIQRLEKVTRLWFTFSSLIQDDITATRFLLKWAPNVWATLEFSVKAKVTVWGSPSLIFSKEMSREGSGKKEGSK